MFDSKRQRNSSGFGVYGLRTALHSYSLREDLIVVFHVHSFARMPPKTPLKEEKKKPKEERGEQACPV